VLVLLSEERGLGSLRALDRASGRTRIITDGLDGPYIPPNLAVSDDARFAWVALASPGVPDPEDRHVPEADRDLDIYRIDLASGAREPIVQTTEEELAPAIGGGFLYWVSIETRMEAVIVPTQGGQARVVAENVQLPRWRPDGRAVGVTTGDWRMADWGLNLDGGVVEIDADGNATGPAAPIVTGYHEDFSPVWSPGGKWIAYHSHRSPTPVSGYEEQGSADDIFLRRPDETTSDEIRLTDFGWEMGMPDWAPDGRRLVTGSINRTEDEGERSSVWIIEIDPETGAVTGRSRLPLPDDARGWAQWQAWSPTREEIAVVFGTTSEAEIWVVPLDGTPARRVVAYPGHVYGGVDWSADGNELIYPAIEDGVQQLFSIALSQGQPRKLTAEARSLFHPQASPDGRWVVASRIRTVSRILRQPLSDLDK
jgi:Tol biopolymer transport system component